MKRLLTVALCLCLWVGGFAQGVVNVYNWGAYIPDAVIRLFEKQTGIRVNYATFDSNQALYVKLKADPDVGYDVIFPSAYYVQRMSREGMLLPLNHDKLSNFSNINPNLLNQSFDPHNRYSVPYLWGSTGILVNAQFYDPKTITRWADLWQPRFRGQLLLTNDVRDVFAVGMRVAGYSINSRNPKEIQAGYLRLKALLPNVKLFNSLGTRPIYLDEDATIGLIDSGDAYVIGKINPKLTFVYPDQVNLWMDCMAIPRGAPHAENAYRFINFILQPNIAKMISIDLGYSSPNAAAVKLMTPAQRANPIVNPPARIFKNAQFEEDVGTKANALYLHYWEMLKLSA